MGISNRHYELLAVTGGHVGPVTGVIHVPLTGGVQALYGRNGAGKTHVLRIVESAVRGAALTYLPRMILDEIPHPPGQSFAHLHLKLADTSDREFGSSPLLRAIASGLSKTTQSVLGRATEESRKDGDPHDSYVHADPKTLVDLVDNLLGQSFPTDADDDYFNRLTDIARQGRLSLVATGTPAAPTWRVWLAYLPTPEEIHRVHRRMNSDGESDVDLDDDDVTAAEPIQGPRPAKNGLKGYVGGERAVLDYLGISHAFPECTQIPVYDLGFEIEEPAADLVGGTADRNWTGGSTALASALRSASAASHGQKPRLTNEVGELSETIRDEMDRVAERANDTLRLIFDPAPQLSVRVGGPADWVVGNVPHWVHQLGADGASFPITDSLSAAELRWARIALGVAEMRFAERPTIVLCDEPEQGLHLSAERRLPEVLAYVAQRDEVAILVATHSHYTLANPSVSVIRADKTPEGGTSLNPNNTISILSAVARRRSEHELSLEAAELQALMKVAVVVEGLHDEIVFSNLVHDEFNAAVAGIFPMHSGAKASSLAEARLMIDGSNAPILVVLDNTAHAEVEPVWTTTLEKFDAGDLGGARQFAYDKLQRSKSSELGYLRQLAIAAIEAGNLGRIKIYGLSRPDVVCYLPEDLILTPGKKKANWTWDRFIQAFHDDERVRKERLEKKFEPRSIKEFLNSNGWLPSEKDLPKAIEDACVAARTAGRVRHDDLNGLAAKVMELSEVCDRRK